MNSDDEKSSQSGERREHAEKVEKVEASEGERSISQQSSGIVLDALEADHAQTRARAARSAQEPCGAMPVQTTIGSCESLGKPNRLILVQHGLRPDCSQHHADDLHGARLKLCRLSHRYTRPLFFIGHRRGRAQRGRLQMFKPARGCRPRWRKERGHGFAREKLCATASTVCST